MLYNIFNTTMPISAAFMALPRSQYLRDRKTTSIEIEGFKFFRESRALVRNRIRWTCSMKHKLKCKACAVTIHGVVVMTSGLHCHK